MKPYQCIKCSKGNKRVVHYRGKIYFEHLYFQKPTIPKIAKANKSLKANLTQLEIFSIKLRFKKLGITNISQLMRNSLFKHLNYLEGGEDPIYKELIKKIDSFAAEAVAVLSTPAPRITSHESEVEWKQARLNNELIKAQTMTNEHANFRREIIPELLNIFKSENKGLVAIGTFDQELNFIEEV